ncbi:MAG TPA: hypothetical protein DCY13_14665 [Verrucomicrobiales bacterium]|nr:hypothetical protein [Verrucomicrobiales bacterium]
MDWQEIVALAVVVLTVALFVRAAVRHRRRRGIEGSCHCAGGASGGLPVSTVLRGRKGERPQLVVKMK